MVQYDRAVYNIQNNPSLTDMGFTITGSVGGKTFGYRKERTYIYKRNYSVIRTFITTDIHTYIHMHICQGKARYSTCGCSCGG